MGVLLCWWFEAAPPLSPVPNAPDEAEGSHPPHRGGMWPPRRPCVPRPKWLDGPTPRLGSPKTPAGRTGATATRTSFGPFS